MYYPAPSTIEDCVSNIDTKLSALISNVNITDFDITFSQGSLCACFYCRKAEGVNVPRKVVGWKSTSTSGTWIIGYEGDGRRIANDIPLATWQWLYGLMDLIEDYANYCFVS